MEFRKFTVLGGASLLVTALLTGCGGAANTAVEEGQDGELTTVRLVSTKTWNSALPALVVHGDFPEEFGLNFEAVNISDAGSSNQVAALMAGSADIASFGINAAADSVLGGADLKIIAGASTSQHTIVASNEAVDKFGLDLDLRPIENIAKLTGATIGTGPEGSASNHMLRAILTDAGLDPSKDVRLVPLADTSGAVAAGLENGVYDATFAPIGAGETAVLRDKAVTMLSVPGGGAEVLEGNISSVVVAPTSLIENQPELIQKIRDSFRAAADMIVDEPDAARDILREHIYPDMEQDLFDMSWEQTRVGYPEHATYGPENWESFVRIFDPLVDADYEAMDFDDIVSEVATK